MRAVPRRAPLRRRPVLPPQPAAAERSRHLDCEQLVLPTLHMPTHKLVHLTPTYHICPQAIGTQRQIPSNAALEGGGHAPRGPTGPSPSCDNTTCMCVCRPRPRGASQSCQPACRPAGLAQPQNANVYPQHLPVSVACIASCISA